MAVRDDDPIVVSEIGHDAVEWLNSFSERRRERRVNIEFPATLFWADEKNEELVEQAYTLSVSNGGASFLVRRPLPVGSSIRVIIHVGANSGVSVADVKWVAPSDGAFHIGVQFKLDVVD